MKFILACLLFGNVLFSNAQIKTIDLPTYEKWEYVTSSKNEDDKYYVLDNYKMLIDSVITIWVKVDKKEKTIGGIKYKNVVEKELIEFDYPKKTICILGAYIFNNEGKAIVKSNYLTNKKYYKIPEESIISAVMDFVYDKYLAEISDYALKKLLEEPSKDTLTKADAFWTAIELLGEMNFVCNGAVGDRWFIAKKSDSKIGNLVKTNLMVYLPTYKWKEHTYNDVIMHQNVLFDCKANQYKIIDIQYSYDFTEVFNIVNNPEGTFKKITVNSVMESVLKKACN